MAPVANEVVTTKSISLRTTLNEIKKANNISGKNGFSTQDQAFCFNFVFPINLSYNNGTVVTVSSYEGLIAVLASETTTFYFEGIQFPFQVQQEGTIITIDDEAEFFALILDCNFHTVNSFVFDFTCYEIVFPISVVNANGETIVVNNQTELVQMSASTPTGTVTYQLDIVFPVSVIQNNETIVINSLYEFFDLNNDCPSNQCIITTEYAPVCVQTTIGIVEYSNPSHAACDGFTPSDFVSCDPPAGDFASLLGTCFNFHYPIQVEHQGAIVTVNSDSELLQYYFPNQAPNPAFVFMVVIYFTDDPINAVLATSQVSFEAAIAAHCN
jgi:hypothetical protein